MNINDKAPDFSLKDTNGNLVRLSDYKGKFIVLYFYPKDMTPGCTKEACNLRDNYKILKENDIEVIGISLDNQESHKKFTNKYNLPFSLLCDINMEVSKKYGVYKKKSFLGKKFMGIERTTFIINPKGKIHFIINEVDVSNHASQIINAIKD